MVCGQPLTLCIYLMDASAGYPKCQCDHSAKHNIPAHLLTKAPLYVSNHNLHNNLNICSLPTLARIYYSNFQAHTHSNPNPLISNSTSIIISNNSPRLVLMDTSFLSCHLVFGIIHLPKFGDCHSELSDSTTVFNPSTCIVGSLLSFNYVLHYKIDNSSDKYNIFKGSKWFCLFSIIINNHYLIFINNHFLLLLTKIAFKLIFELLNNQVTIAPIILNFNKTMCDFKIVNQILKIMSSSQ
ncbi:zinc finger MYM-type protein 6-like [Aphis craccivora]|uniref:Zinc finger MYM-type protein 6-like n=1 Tax=Aphis craccivora TaxID=307492 RepID=A0A6G0Z026_APHCR|nr:zinc finger MYM-type protein 6-like [Aphis craccivora]